MRAALIVPFASTYFGVADEWHLDLEKTVTMEKLGSYPSCPDSRKKPDLSAIRVADRSALEESHHCRVNRGRKPRGPGSGRPEVTSSFSAQSVL